MVGFRDVKIGPYLTGKRPSVSDFSNNYDFLGEISKIMGMLYDDFP